MDSMVNEVFVILAITALDEVTYLWYQYRVIDSSRTDIYRFQLLDLIMKACLTSIEFCFMIENDFHREFFTGIKTRRISIIIWISLDGC
jgi:hypothetical protein